MQKCFINFCKFILTNISEGLQFLPKPNYFCVFLERCVYPSVPELEHSRSIYCPTLTRWAFRHLHFILNPEAKKPMNVSLKIWSWAILGAMLTATSAGAQYGPPTPQTAVPSGGNQARFMCETIDNQYTVTYHPIDRPGDRYPWAIPSTMGSNWNASKRCTEIARRLEEYRRDGLNELRTEVKNQYDTVCVTTQRNSQCRLVFTVPPGQNAISTRDSVFRNLTTADSGKRTIGVNTFADSGNNGFGNLFGNLPGIGNEGNNSIPTSALQTSNSIDLRPFLSTKDGGTATQLREPVTTNSTNSSIKKLNPSRFR
jgi:Circadian oscillating protein COP23